jgi:hypothetical protein
LPQRSLSDPQKRPGAGRFREALVNLGLVAASLLVL